MGTNNVKIELQKIIRKNNFKTVTQLLDYLDEVDSELLQETLKKENYLFVKTYIRSKRYSR